MTPHSSRQVSVLVQHAEPLVAAGLTSILGARQDIALVAQELARSGAHEARVDVVITDYRQGIRLALDSRTWAGRPSALPKILIVTPNDREQEVRSALESGVHGFLQLGCLADELVTAVRMLGQGVRYLAMEVSQRMADSLTRETLTSRETEVLRLLAGGLCNKSIASQLFIGVGTVKAHVRGIMAKLEASSRTQVLSIATRRGLIEEPCLSPTASLAAPSPHWQSRAPSAPFFAGVHA